MSEGNRNRFFDAIKAFAIVLVVYAHSIQYLSGCDYWNNGVFQLIYSFHMPLFFMVSGFFISSSLKLSWKDFLQKKSIALLLPCFVWTIIFSCVQFRGWHETLMAIVNPLNWKLWFLKGLFVTQLIFYVCMRIGARIGGGKTKVLFFAIALSTLVYTLPFMSIPRVMIPMLWVGYIIRIKYDWFIKNYYWIALVSLIAFLILYRFWNSEVQEMYAGARVKIYEVILGRANGIELLKMVYRIMIGACGSVAIIASMHVVKHIPKWISVVGASTAAIYILQSFILEYMLGTFMPKPWFLSNSLEWLFYGYMPIMTMTVIGICVGLSKIIKKNNIISMILLGERKK